MKNGKIQVCVIGSGRAGMIHARNFARSVPNAEIAAMSDPVEEAAAAAVKELGINKYYLDYKDVLKDESIDAVIVVTPTVFHEEIVVAAAAAGKHILCEKPMAMNEQECSNMINACVDAKVKLQIGFMRRFDESFRHAKERIDSGEIGDVVCVKSVTHGPSTPRPWMYDIKKSNGPLAEVSSHDIDTLHWYAGSYIKEVYSIAGNYRCPDAVADYPDFYDNILMNVRFKNDMQGLVDGAQGVKYGYDSRVEIIGTQGIIFVGKQNNFSVMTCSPTGINTPFVESWQNLFLDAYKLEDLKFIESILEDSTPEVTGTDGLEAVKVVNAGNTSIIEKRPVTL
ncbi:MAG: Gfo/Idh/MocA family oxidoreductase [Spirochaetales bacterium]|uniref:Gfo/Idh/MocA family oxidoreductase n=1 Tax=Candidatus Thalassospirochaeta sargassi TaxID=3119039 RepID=A0AAJ1MNV7_9SPIO|nr:Gfo/Idh/MocA family oxidoreductase [Spirochaetales bacterium]